MAELTSVIAAAVAASKEAGADGGAAAEANGDVAGTAAPDNEAAAEPGADGSVEVEADGAVAANESDVEAGADGTPVVDEAAKAAEAAAKAAEETDPFAKEHDLKAKDASGRENRIPYSRVKKITDNAVKKATAALSAEYETIKAHNTEYTDRLTRIAEVESIMFNEPARMLDILRTIPGYEKVLAAPSATSAAAAAGGATTLPAADSPLDFSKAPKPDTADGYSSEGLQSLLAWTADQAATRATAAAEARLTERYKPLEQSFTEHQKQAERSTQLNGRVNSALQDAMTWKHFSENETAILDVLKADSAAAKAAKTKPKHSLRTAYEEVVFGRLSTDRAAIHKEVLESIKRAPKSTSAGGSGGGTKAQTPAEPQNLEDVIRATLHPSA